MQDKSKQNNEFIPNFTQYPNEILDNWMPYLSGNQTKIMNVFVRQIYGFHKDFDKISVRQISFKTGIPIGGVFRDLKTLLSIGAIKIVKKGNKSNPHTYQIVNVTDLLSERVHHKKLNGVIGEITGCYRSDNSGVIGERTDVLSEREQQKKEINIKEICEIKQVVNNNEHDFKKTEQPQAHTSEIKLEEIKNDIYIQSLVSAFNLDLNNISEEEFNNLNREIAVPKKTEAEINIHYQQELAKVEQEYSAQNDIIIPKLGIESILRASDEFLGKVGIGFDNNPRRILNLIYKELPGDFVIKEDSKDVEIMGDLIKKYLSSGKDERDSISRRIYQSVEAMLKIYIIKKFGEPFRDVLYPQILNDNLILYLNCNPTFKYCLGGFSNDIDGVYREVCRLIEKESKKKIDLIKSEHVKKIRKLEADKQAEIQSIFTEKEKESFQKRTDNILHRMHDRSEIQKEPLANPIQVNLTEEEKEELKVLFGKSDKTNADVIRLNILIKKSKKIVA